MLAFVTSCSRAPLLGFNAMKPNFAIVRSQFLSLLPSPLISHEHADCPTLTLPTSNRLCFVLLVVTGFAIQSLAAFLCFLFIACFASSLSILFAFCLLTLFSWMVFLCFDILFVSVDDYSLLPTAATCMNLLRLPAYRTKEQLRKKVLLAIRSGSGFALT